MTKHISCNGSNEVLQLPKVKDERKSIRRSSSTAASGDFIRNHIHISLYVTTYWYHTTYMHWFLLSMILWYIIIALTFTFMDIQQQVGMPTLKSSSRECRDTSGQTLTWTLSIKPNWKSKFNRRRSMNAYFQNGILVYCIVYTKHCILFQNNTCYAMLNHFNFSKWCPIENVVI